LELSRQLNAWREHLPPSLNWNDDMERDIATHPTTAAAPQLTMLRDQSAPAVLDNSVVLNASLRTRYKYAQYLIWRPYIYRVLHLPNSSTDEDIQGCTMAFKVSPTPHEWCSHGPLNLIGLLAVASHISRFPRPATPHSPHL
jgi:hypothetical protein